MSNVKEIGLLGESANGWKRLQVTTEGLLKTEGGGGGGGTASTVLIRGINDDTDQQSLLCDNEGHLKTVLKGLTDITDNATNTNLLCDSDGHLQVDVRNTKSSQSITVTLNNTDTIVSTTYDLSDFTKTKIWGSSDIHKNFIIQYSNNNSNWLDIREVLVLEINSNYVFEQIVECPPKYIRFKNISSSTQVLNIYLEHIS